MGSLGGSKESIPPPLPPVQQPPETRAAPLVLSSDARGRTHWGWGVSFHICGGFQPLVPSSPTLHPEEEKVGSLGGGLRS